MAEEKNVSKIKLDDVVYIIKDTTARDNFDNYYTKTEWNTLTYDTTVGASVPTVPQAYVSNFVFVGETSNTGYWAKYNYDSIEMCDETPLVVSCLANKYMTGMSDDEWNALTSAQQIEYRDTYRGTALTSDEGKVILMSGAFDHPYYLYTGSGEDTPAMEQIALKSDITTVAANPTAEGTTALSKLQVGDVVYTISGGGSGDYGDADVKKYLEGYNSVEAKTSGEWYGDVVNGYIYHIAKWNKSNDQYDYDYAAIQYVNQDGITAGLGVGIPSNDKALYLIGGEERPQYVQINNAEGTSTTFSTVALTSDIVDVEANPTTTADDADISTIKIDETDYNINAKKLDGHDVDDLTSIINAAYVPDVTVDSMNTAIETKVQEMFDALEFNRYYTGTEAPASDLGDDGDLYLQQ